MSDVKQLNELREYITASDQLSWDGHKTTRVRQDTFLIYLDAIEREIAEHYMLAPVMRCRHFEPRTLEDVLEEFADAAADVDERDLEEWVPLLSKYADEIREIIGVEC